MDMRVVRSVPGRLYIAAAELVSEITTFHGASSALMRPVAHKIGAGLATMCPAESLGEAHGHEDFLVSEKGRRACVHARCSTARCGTLMRTRQVQHVV